LRASTPLWRVTRLATGAVDLDLQPSSPVLKHHLAATLEAKARVALVALAGTLIPGSDGPRLVTGCHAQEFPEDASLPLPWLAAQIRAAVPERVVFLLQLHGGAVEAREVAAQLEPERDGVLVAVKGGDEAPSLLDAALTALQGAAIDRHSGNVTLATLRDHLTESGVVARAGDADRGSIFDPPPRSRLVDTTVETARGSGSIREAPISRVGWTLPGRIRVDELIAMGSFGAVYRGRQLTVNRDVAVKVMHPATQDSSEQRDLFFREVEIVGRLRHPNVVQIFHADVSPDGDPFFAMELLSGRTLRQIIDDEAPIPVAR